MQLKTFSGKSPAAVTRFAKRAGEKAEGATRLGLEFPHGIDLYIQAPNVAGEAILSGPLGKILAQQPSLRSINVFSRDGVIRVVR